MGPAIPLLLSLVATTVKGVAGGFLDEGTARSLIFFGANLLNSYGAATEKLEAFVTQIETIVAEKRAPTAEEWAELEARSQAATDRIIAEAQRRGVD